GARQRLSVRPPGSSAAPARAFRLRSTRPSRAAPGYDSGIPGSMPPRRSGPLLGRLRSLVRAGLGLILGPGLGPLGLLVRAGLGLVIGLGLGALGLLVRAGLGLVVGLGFHLVFGGSFAFALPLALPAPGLPGPARLRHPRRGPATFGADDGRWWRGIRFGLVF